MKRLLSAWRFVPIIIALSMAVAQAATRNVTVSGLSFSPGVITITNGDTVVWSGGSGFHTVSPRSGVTETFCGPSTFTTCSYTFNNVGSFAYQCNIHALSSMTGQVMVVTVPGLPPTVSITNPPNNIVLAAPATVPVGITAADSDGTVANVRLMTNGVFAATNAVAPFGFTLSNLPPGFYSLRARAQDNQSLSTTSAPVLVRVATRPAISFQPGSNGPLQFQFTSATGINYVVEQTPALTNFASLSTNPGSGGPLQFSETNSSATQKFIRVRLQ